MAEGRRRNRRILLREQRPQRIVKDRLNPKNNHVAFNGAEGSNVRDYIAQKYFGKRNIYMQ